MIYPGGPRDGREPDEDDRLLMLVGLAFWIGGLAIAAGVIYLVVKALTR